MFFFSAISVPTTRITHGSMRTGGHRRHAEMLEKEFLAIRHAKKSGHIYSYYPEPPAGGHESSDVGKTRPDSLSYPAHHHGLVSGREKPHHPVHCFLSGWQQQEELGPSACSWDSVRSSGQLLCATAEPLLPVLSSRLQLSLSGSSSRCSGFHSIL